MQNQASQANPLPALSQLNRDIVQPVSNIKILSEVSHFLHFTDLH